MDIVARLILTTLAAWLTHIIFCFYTGAWGFLIAGAIFFPVGVLHGVYQWFDGFFTLTATLIGWII